jgi:hypothetical protein
LGITFQHNTIRTGQGLPNCCDLVNNVTAIAAFGNHPLDTAHLTLDSP